MSASTQALLIIGVIVVGTIGFALLAVRRIEMGPTEFIVGGRSFGALLLWILLAGEIYTSTTFLGAAGWAYGKGAPAFFIIAHGPIAYIIGYFYLPAAWRIGKERGLMTWPDFLIDRYGSKLLGKGVAVLQFFLAVPYVTLQLTGLQILLTIAGYGRYNATIAVSVAFLLTALFVFTAGLRGAAWASIIKDSLVLGAAMFAGIYLPIRFFGSPGAMFERLSQTQPHWLSIHAGNAPYGVTWFISTVFLTSIGFFMGPASAQSIFSARSEGIVRRNMIFMPFYGLMIVLMLLAEFTAAVIVPGLKGTAADQSYMLLLQKHFPAWILGIIAGAGCLAALIPASVLLLGAASIFARNVLGHTRYVRVLVLVCAVLSLALWIVAKTSLADLLLFYFNGVTQLAPGVIFGLSWKRVSAAAVGAGLVVGEAVAAYSLHASTGPMGINWGLVALGCNVAVLTAVALVFPRCGGATSGSPRGSLRSWYASRQRQQ